MNAEMLRGNWKILKGRLKQWLARLTDSDRQFILGKQEELYGRIQKRSAGQRRHRVPRGDPRS